MDEQHHHLKSKQTDRAVSRPQLGQNRRRYTKFDVERMVATHIAWARSSEEIGFALKYMWSHNLCGTLSDATAERLQSAADDRRRVGFGGVPISRKPP